MRKHIQEKIQLTNWFFLSVTNFVISFFPAASSSSLYTKSRTINLMKRKINSVTIKEAEPKFFKMQQESGKIKAVYGD